MDATTQTVSLIDFANDTEAAIVFWTSVGNPTGDYELAAHPDLDFVSRNGLDALHGTVVDGEWQWDGTGRAFDDRSNTITRLVCYSDPAKLATILADYEAGN